MTHPLRRRLVWAVLPLFALVLSDCSDDGPGPFGPAQLDSPPNMVEIPAGPFLMGKLEQMTDPSDDAGTTPRPDLDNSPEHVVKLSTYWIDRFEVTVDDYQDCVDSRDCTPAGTGFSLCNMSGTGVGDHPVNCVSWQQADRFCNWVDKRLPTEAEWEKAARGKDGRLYPWGDDAPRAAFVNAHLNEDFDGKTVRVGSKPDGAVESGIDNLGGNVKEWTSDWYGKSYYSDSVDINPQGPVGGDKRVARGGSYDQPATALEATVRHNLVPESQEPTVGFRCGWSPESVTIYADPVLEGVVSDSLRATGKEPDEILSLDLSDSDLRLLNGIESLTSLQSLDLAGNHLADISLLRTLTSLTDLDLSRNPLTLLTPLKDLTALNRLLIDGRRDSASQIDDTPRILDLTPLAELTNLSVLALSNQRISDLQPLAQMRRLTALILDGNRITKLTPVSAMQDLAFLSLRDNLITDVALLENLSKLSVLHIVGNPLDSNAVSTTIPRLRSRGVTVDYSDIVFIDRHFDAAVREQIRKNGMSSTSSSPFLASALEAIDRLDAAGREERQIVRLDGIEALTHLEVLRLDNNSIRDLTPLEGLTSLTSLHLRANRVSDLGPLKDLENLTFLGIADNDVTDSELAKLDSLFIHDELDQRGCEGQPAYTPESGRASSAWIG